MGIILCDVDNTFYDALGRLSDLFEEYDPLLQDDYTFSDQKYLEAFRSVDFYDERYVNRSVVEYLNRLLENPYNRLVFITDALSVETYEAKKRLVSQFFNSVDLQWVNKEVCYHFFKKQQSEIRLLLDDAPFRLDLAKVLGIPYKVVQHPYNRQYGSGLLPNYLEGVSCFKKLRVFLRKFRRRSHCEVKTLTMTDAEVLRHDWEMVMGDFRNPLAGFKNSNKLNKK